MGLVSSIATLHTGYQLLAVFIELSSERTGHVDSGYFDKSHQRQRKTEETGQQSLKSMKISTVHYSSYLCVLPFVAAVIVHRVILYIQNSL